MANVGISFSPTDGNQTAAAGQPNQLQDAIRILSLQVPRTVGMNSPIPQGLLGQTGLGSGLGSEMMQNWLRLIFGGQPPTGGSQIPGPSYPTPPTGGTGGPHIPLPTGPRTTPSPGNPFPLPTSPAPPTTGMPPKGPGLPVGITPGGGAPRGTMPWEDPTQTEPTPSPVPPMREPPGPRGRF